MDRKRKEGELTQLPLKASLDEEERVGSGVVNATAGLRRSAVLQGDNAR